MDPKSSATCDPSEIPLPTIPTLSASDPRRDVPQLLQPLQHETIEPLPPDIASKDRWSLDKPSGCVFLQEDTREEVDSRLTLFMDLSNIVIIHQASIEALELVREILLEKLNQESSDRILVQLFKTSESMEVVLLVFELIWR